ncbi:MAG TPA: glycosyl hydrolase [Micromonosporaceae bacterium]|nr:glycosyl hydrolase [Micromonosporaceae bacterium]
MRRLSLALLGLALLLGASARPVSGDITIGEPPRGPGVYTDAQKERRALAPPSELSNVPGPAGSDHWFAAQRLFPYRPGDGISEQYVAAQAQAVQAAADRVGVAAAWTALGPANIGGRVTDLVVDPVRTDTVYTGAATGGVWRSTNAGGTFTSVWPANLTPSIGALAITSSGTLYAGTGEGNPGGGSVTFPGNGVYRSTDSGATWTHMGLAGSDRIGRLAIDPTNANRIFAAAAGNLFVSGGVRGLYRTTDGGTTWQLVLAGANGTTGAIDVAIDPTTPSRVYAAMWDHQRTPQGRRYGGVGSGIYRSTDGGTTWTRLGGGLPAASSNLGRMGLAVARSNPNRLYAIAANTNGDFLGFWTSTNAGSSWTQITNTSFLSNSQSTYGWWFGRIWVDPNSSQHAFVAGVPMLETLDAGANWRRNTTFHADQHALGWDPRVANRVFLGNDGGVYRSTSNGSLTGSWTKSTALPINQFYTVAVSRQDVNRVSGGAQDNGSLRNWSGTNWNSIGGGDGTTNLIDPTNQLKVYSCSQYGSCTRSTDGGSTRSGFGTTTSDRRNWLTPVVFDPNNPAIMYYAGNRVNRSTNSAASWTVISPDLTRGSGGTGGAVFGTITALAVAKSSASTIYAGTDDGRVWITRNTGSSWTEITAGLPTRWITRIAVDPASADIAYVSVSGYRNGDPGAHVFRTANGGASWTDISAGLPDAPVNDLVLDPRNPAILYAGTDVGVWARTASTWAPVGTALPLVPISDLEATDTGTATVLTAATYGLGMYRTTA